MRILLISTYELGHQPLHLASPAAALINEGHELRCIDLSITTLDPQDVTWAQAIGISVPMHTAMRLAANLIAELRFKNFNLPTCFYGLYAYLAPDLISFNPLDQAISGEYEPDLIAWANSVETDNNSYDLNLIRIKRNKFSTPARHLLPGLENYAKLQIAGQEKLVGYTEASHGCSQSCTHCPVPVIYGGRLRIVGQDVVIQDIENLVKAGASHITFGDPDFLNGIHHSLKIVRQMHQKFPHLTFDCTTKIELILKHKDIWQEMANMGCIFIVSAIESVNDKILEHLEKGHSKADAEKAITLLRSVGIEIRPSFLPFTPWTTLQDLAELCEFISTYDLAPNIDPVQCSIRLLLPKDSLLLKNPTLQGRIGPYDPELLTYSWSSQDPAVDKLQKNIAKLASTSAEEKSSRFETILEIRDKIFLALDNPFQPNLKDFNRPRLTEPWFC